MLVRDSDIIFECQLCSLLGGNRVWIYSVSAIFAHNWYFCVVCSSLFECILKLSM